MMRKFLSVFVSALSVVACQSTPSGVPVLTQTNTSVSAEGAQPRNDRLSADKGHYVGEYKDGKRADGVAMGWYPNGKPKQVSTWKNEMLD